MCAPELTSVCCAAAQVKVHDLHGKNYIFTLTPTFQPIAEDGCVAVASKTRKNILITMQVRPSPVHCAWKELKSQL